MRLGGRIRMMQGMTSTGIQVEALTSAIENVEASQAREGGHVRTPGFDPAEQPFRVRHLVIFRAPVVGYARPGADGVDWSVRS